MRVALTTSSFAVYGDEPIKLLEAAGVKYVTNPHGRKLTEAETLTLARGCAGIVAGTEPLTRIVMESLRPELKAIARCGVGMDNVDLEAAKELGIAVSNTPFGPTRAVAELTVGLILDLLRRITLMDREMRAKIWKKQMGWLLLGKRVGLIGFGRIGQAVCELLSPFGVELAYADPCIDSDKAKRMELDELLAWADIVSLHCSMDACGCPLLDKERLTSMRQGSWLINAGRGGLVDEDALYDLIQTGHIAGAALDSFADEPYLGPLAAQDNVILTPHIGSYAREGRIAMETDAVKNILRDLGKA